MGVHQAEDAVRCREAIGTGLIALGTAFDGMDGAAPGI